MNIPTSLCIGDDKNRFRETKALEGVIGHWTFDDSAAQDTTRNKNHVKKTPNPGPGFGARGNSASFNGRNWMRIDHHEAYETSDFMVAMWVFVKKEVQGSFKTLLFKGSKGRGFPAVSVFPESRKLRVKIATIANGVASLDSVSTLPLRRWTHVAVGVDGFVLTIYVNGVIDAQVVIAQPAEVNKKPLYVGGTPFTPGLNCYVDDLRYFARPPHREVILSMGQPSLPGTFINGFTTFGCAGCSWSDALGACLGKAAHVCSRMELASGALTQARVFGWFDVNSDRLWNWVKGGEREAKGTLATAVCCSNQRPGTV